MKPTPYWLIVSAFPSRCKHDHGNIGRRDATDAARLVDAGRSKPGEFFLGLIAQMGQRIVIKIIRNLFVGQSLVPIDGGLFAG